MVIWLCLRWWYGAGWQWAAQRSILERLKSCNEMFSIGALFRTLFAPFKQTVTRGQGSLDMRMHIFMDNIISRFVGFFARSFIIVAGLAAALFVFVSGVLFTVLWPLIPLSLPIALVLLVAGVGA